MRHKSLIDSNNNNAQRYLTHSVFRFFGKYPPTSTRMLLEKLWNKGATGPVVDIMCGSGTTLLEALLAGHAAVGIDVNPICVLISKVKTEKANPDKVHALLFSIHQAALEVYGTTFEISDPLFPPRKYRQLTLAWDDIKTVRDRVLTKVRRWFSDESAIQHAVLRAAIDSLPDTPEKRLVQLAWLKTIRKSSRASTSIGRLFLDKQKNPQLPFTLFVKECAAIIEAQLQLPQLTQTSNVKCATAFELSKVIHDIQTIFWHPPYFALYKYSSDVLRLELEWLEVERKALVQTEIRDGFKTSNPEDADKYLSDCRIIWKEMYDACATGARGVAINSDSTLAKKRLNIFDRFAAGAESVGFKVEMIYQRETTGTQAQYHKSADSETKTNCDYIILFKKP